MEPESYREGNGRLQGDAHGYELSPATHGDGGSYALRQRRKPALMARMASRLRPGRLRPARPRCGAAFRGQPRHDAVHVLRARHPGLGNLRSGLRAALRGRRPAAHAQAAPGAAQERLNASARQSASTRRSAPVRREATERVAARHDIRVVTYSSRLWRPAPPGPKRTDGMPAAPSTAASVQKLMPALREFELPSDSTALDEQTRQRVIWRAIRTAGAKTSVLAVASNSGSSRARSARIAVTSSSAVVAALHRPIVRRSICSRQRPDTS